MRNHSYLLRSVRQRVVGWRQVLGSARLQRLSWCLAAGHQDDVWQVCPHGRQHPRLAGPSQ